MDFHDLTFLLERLPQGKRIVKAIPAPTGGKGGINPHISRFILNTGETVDVFHVKPIYYAHVEGDWRPMSEVASHYGNHSIVLKEDWAQKVELAYLAWLIKRMELVGGTVSIPSPFSAPIPLSETARPGYAQIHLSTLTTYPDPDPETTTVDGFVLYENASWSTCRSAATGSVASDSSSTFDLRVNTNYRIARLFTLFDTSALTAAATISAADLSLYKTTGDGQDDAGGKSVYVIQTTPASNTALTTSDFDDVGSTSGGSSAVSSGWINATTGYQTVSLNATGIGWISKTGITKLGLRGSYDFDNVTPGSRLHINDLGTSEQSGTTQDPKLVVTYTAGTNVTATPSVLSFTASLPAATITAVKNIAVAAAVLVATFSFGAGTTSSGPNSPGTLANDATVGSTAWTNPSNAAASDNSYAVASGIGAFSTYAGVNGTGIEDGPIKLVKGGVIGGDDLSTLANYPTSDTYLSYGGPTSLWGLSWTPADINASNFGVAVSARETKFDETVAQYLKATNFGFSIPTTATINGIKVEVELKADTALLAAHTDAYIDHIRITVYYSTTAATVTTTSNVTNTPSSLSSAFSIQAPSIVTDVSHSASVIAASFSLPTATATTDIHVTVEPEALTASFSTAAPDLSYDYEQAGSALAATFSIPAPTVSADVTLAPSALTISLSLQAATIETSTNITIEPSALVLAISTQAADLALDTVSTPATLAASFSSASVTVTADRSIVVEASPLEAAFSLPSAIISYDFAVDVSPLAAAFAPQPVTIVLDVNVDVSASVLTVTASSPGHATVTDQVLSAAVLSLTASIQAPSVAFDFAVDVSAGMASFTIPTPTVQAEVVHAANVVTLTLSQPSASFSLGVTVLPSPVTAAISAPQTAVSAEANAAVSPLAASFSVQAPSIATDQALSISPLSAICSLPSPTLSLGCTLDPSPLLAAISLPQPTVLATNPVKKYVARLTTRSDTTVLQSKHDVLPLRSTDDTIIL